MSTIQQDVRALLTAIRKKDEHILFHQFLRAATCNKAVIFLRDKILRRVSRLEAQLDGLKYLKDHVHHLTSFAGCCNCQRIARDAMNGVHAGMNFKDVMKAAVDELVPWCKSQTSGIDDDGNAALLCTAHLNEGRCFVCHKTPATVHTGGRCEDFRAVEDEG